VNPRGLTNLVLLGVVIALAWLAIGPGRHDEASPTLPLTALEPAAVTRIVLERPPARAIHLQRSGDGWRLTEPLRTAADAHRVRRLLELPAARSRSGFRAAGNDLSQYGLEPPQARLLFDSTTVLVGGTEPISARRYLLAGDQVHLLEDRWFAPLFADAAWWVDPRPLPEGARLAAIRLPDAHWRLEGASWRRTPPQANVSADAGPVLVQAWRHARAASVRPVDPALHWNERVVLELRGAASPLVLHLARSPDAVLLARLDLGVQYRFSAQHGAVLLGRAREPSP
jgi:hypothetical protein